jgi:molecular chaperone GrpE (heat shock protein)
LHDALCRVPAEEGKKESGTISMVMKPGYKLKDRVIRAAEVAAVA